MILALKVKNFLSIEKESIISFLSLSFNNENETIKKEDILNKIAFLGNNNSGKSNILKSIKVIKEYFLKNNHNFLKNTTFIKNNNKESNIELTFSISSSLSKFFTLGIKYKKDILISEYLYLTFNYKNKNIDKKIYEYNFINNEFIDDKNNTDISFNKIYKDYIKTSSLYSFLSFIDKTPINDKRKINKDIISKIYSYLKNDLLIFDPLSTYSSSYSKDNNELISFNKFDLVKFNTYLKEFDLGIEKALFINKLDSKNNNNLSIINNLLNKGYKLNTLYLSNNSSSLFKIVKSNDKNNKYILKELVFNDFNIDYNFLFKEESLGSKKIILLLLILSSLKNNKTYIFDEIDVSIHPLLFNKFLLLINNLSFYYSQLIFSTHYIDSLLYLNSESIYLISKINSSSFINSLIEYKGINNMKDKKRIIKKFKEGRYNGVPSI